MDHNIENIELHRVSECDECSQTDWDTIKSEISGAIDKCLAIKTLTPEEHRSLTIFINECSSDQIACLVQVIASGIGAAQDIVENISLAAQSFAEMIVSIQGGSPKMTRRTRPDD